MKPEHSNEPACAAISECVNAVELVAVMMALCKLAGST